MFLGFGCRTYWLDLTDEVRMSPLGKVCNLLNLLDFVFQSKTAFS